MQNSPENRSQCPIPKGRRWLTVAFLFFLIKGLVWLAAGTGLTLLAWNR